MIAELILASSGRKFWRIQQADGQVSKFTMTGDEPLAGMAL